MFPKKSIVDSSVLCHCGDYKPGFWGQDDLTLSHRSAIHQLSLEHFHLRMPFYRMEILLLHYRNIVCSKQYSALRALS